jgi:hypothetical protein
MLQRKVPESSLPCHHHLPSQSLMRAAMSQLNLSARAIADLAGSEKIHFTTGRVSVVQIKVEAQHHVIK